MSTVRTDCGGVCPPGRRTLLSWDDPPPAERECAVTFQQMLKTLWARKLTIVVSVVVCVAAALAYSKVSTPTYQSTALIQVTTPSQSGSSTSSSFTLPDPVQELASTAVLDAAAKNLHDPNPSSIAGLVTGSVDPTTGALTITGTGSTAAGAQAVTQAYAQAFVDQIQALADAQNDKYTAAINEVSGKIACAPGPGGAEHLAQRDDGQRPAQRPDQRAVRDLEHPVDQSAERCRPVGPTPRSRWRPPRVPRRASPTPSWGPSACWPACWSAAASPSYASSSTTASASARTSSRSSTARCWASSPRIPT